MPQVSGASINQIAFQCVAMHRQRNWDANSLEPATNLRALATTTLTVTGERHQFLKMNQPDLAVPPHGMIRPSLGQLVSRQELIRRGLQQPVPRNERLGQRQT